MIELGDKIDGRYRVVSRIAHGGMADVYEGYDIVAKRSVAIKVMRKDMMASSKNLERFERECEAASSLNDPNIVKVYGQGEVDGRPYMVNEYVDGRTLRDKLNVVAGHFLSPLESSEIMVQLCSGIEYIHQHGLLHRDIKPDNLFYLPDGSIKIADFGISTPVGEKSSDGDAIAGTVHYTAPEILMGYPARIESDIYSMGIVYYELLTGTVPFDAPTPEEVAVEQIKKHFPEPSRSMPDVSKAIDRIVVKACRKRPEERFRSAAQMKEAILEALKDGSNFKAKKGLLSRIFGFK